MTTPMEGIETDQQLYFFTTLLAAYNYGEIFHSGWLKKRNAAYLSMTGRDTANRVHSPLQNVAMII